MLRNIGVVAVALNTAHASLAQAPKSSAPISDISYEITADSSAVGRKQLAVVMSFRVSGTAPVVLALPAAELGMQITGLGVHEVGGIGARVAPEEGVGQ